MTRGQMAAFLKRLSEGKIVNAATAETAVNATNATNATNAVNATNATNAVNATNADNADTLDGKDSTYYENPVVSVLGDDISMPFNAVVELGEVAVTAPSSGGLVIDGTLVTEFSVTSGASFWFQVDNGTCEFVNTEFFSVTYGIMEVSAEYGHGSIHGVAPAAAGAHTVTFCGRVFVGATMTVDTSLITTFSADVTSSGTITEIGGGGGGGGGPRPTN